MYRIGFIGAGGMGSTHIKALKQMESRGESIAAVADPRPERVSWVKTLFPAAVGYADGKELIEKEKIDAVFIASPSYLHAPFILAALAKGMDVFCEKPLCLSKADAKEILAAEEASGRYCQVGMVLRFMWQYRWLEEAIRSGKFGALKSMSMRRLSALPDWGYQNWYLEEEKSGSVVLDLSIHDIDFLSFLFGEELELKDSMGSCLESGLCNHVYSLFSSGGVKLSVEAAWHQASGFPFSADYRAEFEKATCFYDFEKDRIWLGKWGEKPVYIGSSDQEVIDASMGMNISSMGAYYVEDSYFLDHVLGDAKGNLASFASGARSVELALDVKERAER